MRFVIIFNKVYSYLGGFSHNRIDVAVWAYGEMMENFENLLYLLWFNLQFCLIFSSFSHHQSSPIPILLPLDYPQHLVRCALNASTSLSMPVCFSDTSACHSLTTNRYCRCRDDRMVKYVGDARNCQTCLLQRITNYTEVKFNWSVSCDYSVVELLQNL